MAEKQNKPYKNIEELGGFLGKDQIGALQKAISASEAKVSSLLKRLAEMEEVQTARRIEEEARAAEALQPKTEEKPVPAPVVAPVEEDRKSVV